MCREINGVLYDTENSTIEKKFTYGAPGDDDGYEETLYLTDDGRYFIYTCGGTKSKYPKENITPIARDDLRNWVLSR